MLYISETKKNITSIDYNTKEKPFVFTFKLLKIYIKTQQI